MTHKEHHTEQSLPPPAKAGGPMHVSILVPVHNVDKFLSQCLDSLSRQTYSEIEFICINDGSTDASAATLDAWAAADKRFKVIHQANGGYGKAMNEGLKAASGSYIGIVEPDDWVDSDMFQRLMELAQKHGADIVKSNYIGERINRSRKVEKIAEHLEGSCFSPVELPDYLEGAPSIWSAIYRREWLHEHNIRFSETPGASFQDLGFCIRTWLAAKKIATTHAAYYHYREDNPTASSRRKEDGAWAAYREIELLTDTFSLIPQDAATIRSCIVKRIFATLRADYRIRIQNTVKSFLLKYSNLLNRYFPQETLEQDIFTHNEWHDLQLLYTTPLLFPRKSRTRVNALQRLFSCRTEAGRKILRIMGFSFELRKKALRQIL